MTRIIGRSPSAAFIEATEKPAAIETKQPLSFRKGA